MRTRTGWSSRSTSSGWRRGSRASSVGPRRNHDGGHQDEVRGRARALPLPPDRALAAAGRHARAPLEGAARDPGPPLLHVVRPRPLPRGRRAHQAGAARPSSSATPGRWRSSSSCGSKPCGRTGWSTTTSSSSAPRAAGRRATPAT